MPCLFRSLVLLPVLLLAGCAWVEPSLAPVGSPGRAAAPRLLIFTRTAGYRHDSIPDGVRCLRELAVRGGLEVEHSEDPGQFTDANLARFGLVAFLSTTGDVLPDPAQQAAFERWMESGGRFLGIHAATDTEYGWPWYGRMVGARFASHPRIQQAEQEVVARDHPATAHLPARWRRTDEWYDFREIQPGLTVLLRLDESTYQGGANGADHPSAWCRTVGAGRMFYTAGGHTKASFAEPEFRAHLAGALRWLVGPAGPVTPSPASR